MMFISAFSLTFRDILERKKNSLEYNYECWLQIDTGIKHQEIKTVSKLEYAFYKN